MSKTKTAKTAKNAKIEQKPAAKEPQAKRIRKPLTDAQRKRKNALERKRRRAVRAEARRQRAEEKKAACSAKSAKSGKAADRAPARACSTCRGCHAGGKCGKGCGGKAHDEARAVAAHAVEIARLLLDGAPVLALPPGLEGTSFERSLGEGVTRRIICLPGHTVDMTVVDESVATHLLRRELERQAGVSRAIEREVSDIVERQKDAE